MKYIKLFEKFVGDNKLKAFFATFTKHFKLSNSMRFLPIQEEREMVCKYLEEQKPNNFPIYRVTYEDYGNIGKARKGQEVYEPLMSCSASKSQSEGYLKKLGDNDRISFGGKSGSLPQLVLIVFEKGTKTADIDDISLYKGQEEHVIGGKFKILDRKHYNLDYVNYAEEKHSLDVLEITVKQMFDESFIDCFNKMSPVRDLSKPGDNKVENNNYTEDDILQYYEKYKKLSIQGGEVARIEKKGVTIDDVFLSNLLSKRIYNNCTSSYKMPYHEFLDIMKRNNCKIYGGKKFGYPELDFAENIE